MPQAASADADLEQFPYWRGNMRALTLGTFLNTLGFTVSFPYLALIIQELGVQGHLETWTGVVAGGYFAVSFLLSPVWGALADHYGRKSMVLRAGLGMGVGFGLLALSGSMAVFLPVFIVVGACNGYVPAAIALVATNTPRRYMGRALASVQSAAMLGTTAGPAVGVLVMGLLPSYRALFFVSCAMSFIAGAIALIGARERPQPPQGPFRLHLIRDSRVILAVPRIWLLFGINFLFSIAIFGSTTVMALYVLNIAGDTLAGAGAGLSLETWVGIATMALTIAGAVSAPVWGRWLDRFEPARILALSLGAAMAASWLFPFVQTPLQLTGARIALGLCAGGIPAAAVTLIKRWSPPGMDARSLALGTALSMLGNGAAPLLAGIIGPLLGLRVHFAVIAGMLAVGLVLWTVQGLRARGEPAP